MDQKPLTKISDYIWEIPTSYKTGMKVPARIFASEKLLKEMDEGVVDQLTNVAQLPGLVGCALAMPDAHWGYGAPIGAVFATDPKQGGVISPGSVGFDINCGVRLLTTNLAEKEVKPQITDLINLLFSRVPSGVGQGGLLKLNEHELKEVMVRGSEWAVKKGFGWEEDLKNTEEGGKLAGADPEMVSKRALERGKGQIGTLGSGNHYLEIQVVKEIFDPSAALRMGVKEVGQITVMIHCGSRGFGHQVATDYLKIFEETMPKYKIVVPDPQLAAAPFDSPEGQAYFGAMASAVNVAFANRQVIMHRVREAFAQFFGRSAQELEMKLVYDVAHNIAKVEEHQLANSKPADSPTRRVEGIKPDGFSSAGTKRRLVVHRKGATRSFPNQPVIIGGSMETGSYLMVGTEKAMKLSFGSTAHGSGRTMSRAEAKRRVRGEKLQKEMKERGIYVRSSSMPGLAEEAGIAYKDISEVVEVTHQAGLSRKIASFVPIGNIKG